jgi:hypothetical protein
VEHEAARLLDAINPHFPLDASVFDIGMREGIPIGVNPYGLSDPCPFGSYQNIRGFAV